MTNELSLVFATLIIRLESLFFLFRFTTLFSSFLNPNRTFALVIVEHADPLFSSDRKLTE